MLRKKARGSWVTQRASGSHTVRARGIGTPIAAIIGCGLRTIGGRPIDCKRSQKNGTTYFRTKSYYERLQ